MISSILKRGIIFFIRSWYSFVASVKTYTIIILLSIGVIRNTQVTTASKGTNMIQCSPHDFYIYGVILKPNIKTHYHNNFVFCCSKCGVVHITVNNRMNDIIEFENIEKLGRFCIMSRYKGKTWPKV